MSLSYGPEDLALAPAELDFGGRRGQMAVLQPLTSSAFIRNPPRAFSKLQLNLQALHPGGDVVTRNVEVKQTG